MLDERQLYRRTLTGFAVVSDAARLFWAKLELGDVIELKGSRPRNLGHHRKFFALIKTAAQNTAYTPEQFRHVLTVAMGHCDFVPDGTGGICGIPKSISFAKMDQTEFEAFYDRAIDTILQVFLPGTDRADLDEAVMEVMRFAG